MQEPTVTTNAEEWLSRAEAIYGERIVAFIERRLFKSDPASDAHDLLQDVFASLIPTVRGYHENGTLESPDSARSSSLITTAATRKIISEIRKRRAQMRSRTVTRRYDELSSEDRRMAMSPLEILEQREQQTQGRMRRMEAMKSAMLQLSEEYRRTLELFREGHSEAEIAKKLEIPVGTVKSRKSNAIKKLKSILGEAS